MYGENEEALVKSEKKKNSKGKKNRKNNKKKEEIVLPELVEESLEKEVSLEESKSDDVLEKEMDEQEEIIKNEEESNDEVYEEDEVEEVLEQEEEVSEEDLFEENEEEVDEIVLNHDGDSKRILSFKPDWISILIKFGIFLVLAFVVIFVVTKLRNQGDPFSDNLERMKEVSYIYYKASKNRPTTLNEEVSMTLGDMEKGSLIEELKVKKDVCSKEYSYVSLVKLAETKYKLKVYLSCGGKGQEATYDVSYEEEKTNEEMEKVLLYELKREVSSEYTCPSDYVLSGRYCVKSNTTEVISATPRYRIIPERNTRASYKSGDTVYEYVEPFVTITPESLSCPSGYELSGDKKCVQVKDAYYKSSTSYTCPNGGTPTGSKCLFTVLPNVTNYRSYCERGVSMNGSCYVTRKYSVSCIHGKYDSSRKSCYTTYNASRVLTDWLFDGKVTYSSSKVLHDTETVSYRVDEVLDNGKTRYSKYIKKYQNVCDGGDVLSGSTCKHYDSSYEQRICDAGYSLSSDQSECYKYEDMVTEKISETYTCPDGYSSRGSGSSKTCYRYENAVSNKVDTPYCSLGYDLTSDNKCVKQTDPKVIEEKQIYTCPDGYTKRGSGSSTSCYKKTSQNSYYYCSNTNATLNGTRCVVPSSTTFLGYSCPIGYEKNGNQCIKESQDKILATKSSSTSTSEEVIWSKTKELDGWVWTGNSKEV